MGRDLCGCGLGAAGAVLLRMSVGGRVKWKERKERTGTRARRERVGGKEGTEGVGGRKETGRQRR